MIGTGGVASLFEGATAAIDHFDHDLTIRGLLEIHRRNTQSAGAMTAAARATSSSSCRSAGRTRSA